MNLEKLWKLLTNALSGAEITGFLDGVAFSEVSFKGSGRKAFVVKGWIDPQEGGAIRYRADWENLQDGEIFFQTHPDDKSWQETDEGEFRLERGGTEISIVKGFKTNDGIQHEVRFTAGIDLGDIFGSFLTQ